MMKFIMIMFMNFMIMYKNNMVMFYYNLCYLFSFMLIFMFMYKDVEWFNIIMGLGSNYYSMMLMMLSLWILGLMFMCLKKFSKLKLLIFVNMLVLMMFFMFMDMILFYLMFEISMVPTFFKIIYWCSNPERLSAGYYMMMCMLLISFPLLVYNF